MPDQPDKEQDSPQEAAGEASHSIRELKLDPENARRHPRRNVEMIRQSLREVGTGRSIVIDEDGIVLAGNGVIESAGLEGIEKLKIIDVDGDEVVAIRRSNLTPEQKKRLALFDNRTAELSDWDMQRLFEEKGNLGGMFTDLELDAMFAEFEKEIPGEDPGADLEHADELRDRYGVQEGQIWLLDSGNGHPHRLMCGDSKDTLAVELLLDSQKAQLVMADPPYNVAYTGGSTNEDNRMGADIEEQLGDDIYSDWLQHILLNGNKNSDERAALMLWFATSFTKSVIEAVEGAGWEIRTMIIWNKLKAHYGALGAQYKLKYEPLFYCHKVGQPPRFYGATNETTVWDEDQPRTNDLHPTMKPVPLYEKCIRNHTVQGDKVLELFVGSGTSLIASERLARRCYGMEKAPQFIGVALERWALMTGYDPVLLHQA